MVAWIVLQRQVKSTNEYILLIYVFVCSEFRSFVLNQDNNRRQWLAAEQNSEGLQDTIKRLQSENAKLDTQVKHARWVEIWI